MIKVSFLLIFYHFFRVWFWRLYESFTWKKKWFIYFFLHEFKVSHKFVSWQCSVTCQDVQAYWLGIWDFTTSTIFSWSLTHQLPFFFKHLDTSLCLKTFCSKGEVNTTFKDFLASKPGINNFVNRWQKCIDVQGSDFHWLKDYLNSLIQKLKFI